jgi:hypothetical protein
MAPLLLWVTCPEVMFPAPSAVNVPMLARGVLEFLADNP